MPKQLKMSHLYEDKIKNMGNAGGTAANTIPRAR